MNTSCHGLGEARLSHPFIQEIWGWALWGSVTMEDLTWHIYCLVCWVGLLQQNTTVGDLEQQKFIVSQFWRPKSSCGQATRPRKVLGKDIFQTSLLVAFSVPKPVDDGLPLTVSLQAVFTLYLSVSGSKLLPSIRTPALLFFFNTLIIYFFS